MQITTINDIVNLFTKGGSADSEVMLCCPVCDYEYVSVNRIYIVEGYEPMCWDGNRARLATWEEAAIEDYTQLFMGEEDTGYRGQTDVIEFVCECKEHHFQLRFNFHKGQTYVTVRKENGKN